MPDPTDPTKCVARKVVKQVKCKRGHRVDQISFENYNGEKQLSHDGFAGGAWRHKDQVLNLDTDEHIKRVEAHHIEGGYLNDELAKIVYFTNKDKIVSCYYDRVNYKTSMKVFEAPVGEQIIMVHQYKDKRKCCGRVTGISTRKPNLRELDIELGMTLMMLTTC